MVERRVVYDPIDPDASTSFVEMRVRFCETDLMGIVHHASYLVYFEAGRVDWLRRRGVTYSEWASRGVHLPVVDAQLSYKAPLRFDDVMTVATTLSELRAASIKFSYVITRGDVRIAEGSTRLACIDSTYKPLRIPGYMRDVLLARETA